MNNNLKKNINDIKKNYSLGIIGGGQLALMLTEAAKKRDLEVCVQTKSCEDPAGLKADHVIEADPLKIRGNKSLINNLTFFDWMSSFSWSFLNLLNEKKFLIHN